MENYVNDDQGYREGEAVDVDYLTKEFQSVRSDLSGFRQEAERNANTRFCRWANQTDDGRKDYDKAAPWKGASDLRYPLVDDIINTNAAALTLSLNRASVQAVPVEASDIKRAKLVGEYMRWRMHSQMSELPNEAELAAQWLLEKGGCVVGVFWLQESIKHNKTVYADEIEQAAAESGLLNPDESIFDPLNRDLLELYLTERYSEASKKKRDTAISELSDTGETVLPMVMSVVNRPMVRAFRKGEDVIFSKNATDIQDAPVVFRIEYKTPQEVLSYVNTDDWDKDWVESAIKGAPTSLDNEVEFYDNSRFRDGITFNEDRKDMVMIVWAYQKLVDEEGVVSIRETIFSPRHKPKYGTQPYAKSGQLDYHLNGRYPFHDFSRERISRLSFNSRGVPEKGGDFQRIAKWQWDAMIDNSSLRLNPPRWYTIGRPPPVHGPGGQFPVRREGESGYVKGPDYNPADENLMLQVINQARSYHGLSTTPDMEADARMKQQIMVDRWLRNWQEVFRMVWWLDQQFGDPVTMFRVMGSNSSGPQEFQRNPAEQIDFYLSFEVLSTDPKAMEKRLANILKIGSEADRNGLIDWTELVRVAVETVDPVLAERVVKPENQANQEQMEEAIEHFQKLYSGMDVTLPQQGINTQVFRQMLQQWIQGSEDIPAKDVQQRLQTDEAFKARIEKLVKQLDFQDQQAQNAQTGRIGVNQGNLQ